MTGHTRYSSGTTRAAIDAAIKGLTGLFSILRGKSYAKDHYQIEISHGLYNELRDVRDDLMRLRSLDVAATPSIELLRVAIADGFNNGNQQYEECTPDQQRRFDEAARAVSKLRPDGVAQPQPVAALADAAIHILNTFRKDEADGYRSKDRQFAITIIEGALALPSTDRRTYCEYCDLEHRLHHDEVFGFHHVVKGETVPCALSPAHRGSP